VMGTISARNFASLPAPRIPGGDWRQQRHDCNLCMATASTTVRFTAPTPDAKPSGAEFQHLCKERDRPND
jgi:hypothetical protein